MEIKSRMWDTLKKEMRCEPFLKTGDGSGDWVVFLSDQIQIERHKDCLTFKAPYPRERFIETRYANIKDRNGKEEYEGDIIRVKLSRTEIDGFSAKIIIGDVRIRAAGGTGIIVRKMDTKKADGIKIGSFLKLKQGKDEIIGNVFENFEIIRKVK